MTYQDAKVKRERFFGMVTEARGAACDESYVEDYLLALMLPWRTYGAPKPLAKGCPCCGRPAVLEGAARSPTIVIVPDDATYMSGHSDIFL